LRPKAFHKLKIELGTSGSRHRLLSRICTAISRIIICRIPEMRMDEPGILSVGAAAEADFYSGLIQDLRIFSRKLTPA